MAEMSKRSLRQRRAPKNFDSQNEQQQQYGCTGYSKTPYPKQNHQIKNGSQQLNSDARILVKFLTSINKIYQEYSYQHRRKEVECIKEPVPLREKKGKGVEGEGDVQRRQNNLKENIRKVKEGHISKGQKAVVEHQLIAKSQLLINKCKALNSQSASKMLNIQSSIRNRQTSTELIKGKQQTNKPQAIYRTKQPQASFRRTNPNISIATDCKQSVSNFKNIFFGGISKEKAKRIEEIEANLNIPKATIGENKIFKRSAYHVAIAYHIYLKKLREKGTFGLQIDPTYSARKLKEGMNR